MEDILCTVCHQPVFLTTGAPTRLPESEDQAVTSASQQHFTARHVLPLLDLNSFYFSCVVCRSYTHLRCARDALTLTSFCRDTFSEDTHHRREVVLPFLRQLYELQDDLCDELEKVGETSTSRLQDTLHSNHHHNIKDEDNSEEEDEEIPPSYGDLLLRYKCSPECLLHLKLCENPFFDKTLSQLLEKQFLDEWETFRFTIQNNSHHEADKENRREIDFLWEAAYSQLRFTYWKRYFEIEKKKIANPFFLYFPLPSAELENYYLTTNCRPPPKEEQQQKHRPKKNKHNSDNRDENSENSPPRKIGRQKKKDPIDNRVMQYITKHRHCSDRYEYGSSYYSFYNDMLGASSSSGDYYATVEPTNTTTTHKNNKDENNEKKQGDVITVKIDLDTVQKSNVQLHNIDHMMETIYNQLSPEGQASFLFCMEAPKINNLNKNSAGVPLGSVCALPRPGILRPPVPPILKKLEKHNEYMSAFRMLDEYNDSSYVVACMEQLNKTSRRVTTRKVAQASGTTTVVTVPEIKPPPPPSAPPHKREKEKEEDEYHLWLSHQLNVPTAAPDTRPPRIMQDEEDEDQPLVRKETIHPTPVSSSPSLSQPKLPTLKQEPDTSQEGKDDNDSTQEESKSRTEICPQCGIVLTTFRSLRRHCSRAHPLIHFNEETLGRTDCPRCGEVFPTRSAYRHHRSAQACTRRDAALAEEAAPAPMIAPIAGAATKEEEEAIKKKILLSKREKCPYCQLVFIGSFRLKRHAKAVHADRPVPEGRRDCGVCGEVFPTRQDYIAHRMSKACFPDWMTGRRGTKEEDDENEGAEKRVKQEEDGEE